MVLIYLPLRDIVSCQVTLQASFVQRLSNFIHRLSSSLWHPPPPPPPPPQVTLNITPYDKYLNNNWSSHHSINDWFSEWIKLPVRPSHEIRLEKIPTEYHKTIECVTQTWCIIAVGEANQLLIIAIYHENSYMLYDEKFFL